MQIRITVQGGTPLLMHNVRLANPIDKFTQAVSEAASNYKATKTEADFAELARREWLGGLYWEPEIGPYVPASWIKGSLIRGGVAYGRKGTTVKAALHLDEDMVPLASKFPENLADAWKDDQFRDVRGVKVGKNVVMRTRPRFDVWAVETTAYLDENLLDLKVLRSIAEKAGFGVGMGDFRPEKGGTFGRFTAIIEETR